ncbi:MAG: glutamyl-tRNA reductase [Desertimonas sp.]
MSVVVIGVNHRTGPLSLLERVAIAPDDLPKAVAGLASRDHVREVAVLSTCHRTEVYAVTERFHPAYTEIRDFLCHAGEMSADELHPYLYSQHDDAAARHLFEVAAGLQSAVLGESEIIGQVRSAWQLGQQEGTVRSRLDLLFRHALRAGKRARAETAIGRGTASVSHAAVEMVTDRLGDLADRRVLVVGAGDMGVGVARALHRGGVADIAVANRTPERGDALAATVDGRACGLDQLDTVLADADVVVACTASGESVVTAHDLSRATAGGRPMLVVDIAVPRAVEAEARALPDVTVLDLDDLRDWADRGLALRATEIDRVRAIVEEEVERFGLETAARQAAPLVAQLHARAEAIRAAELDRYTRRLSGLDDDDRATVDALTRNIIAKLLHEPSSRLRHGAGTPRGDRNAAAVADLFDLS